MAIKTTINWGRELTADELAYLQGELTKLADQQIDGTELGVSPDVRTWLAIDAGTSWQDAARSDTINPPAESNLISLP